VPSAAAPGSPEHDVPPAQTDPMGVTALARAMGIHPPTLSRALSTDPDPPLPVRTVDRRRLYRLPDIVRWWDERSARPPSKHLPRGRVRTTAEVNALDWSRLVGLEVTISSPGSQPWNGVFLPSAGHTRRREARVSVTHRPFDPPAPGDVTTIDLAAVFIDPMPGQVDAYPRGPGGLPLYLGSIPADAVATPHDLEAVHHRLLSSRTQAVAWCYVDDVPTELYAIADAHPIPQLRLVDQAAWTQARTCARCGKRQFDRFPQNHFGPPYCPSPCRNDEAKDRWLARRARDREDVTRWAREIRAIPNAIWIHSTWGVVTPLLMGSFLTGDVLDNRPAVSVVPGDRPGSRRPDGSPHIAHLADVASTASRLAGARIIAWDRDSAAIIDNPHFRDVVGDDTLALLDGDVFQDRYARWLGLPYSEHPDDYYTQPPGLMLVDPPADARACFVEVVCLLREMAAGDPSPARLAAARAHQATHRVLSLTRTEAYCA
jgi:hypothetical protein